MQCPSLKSGLYHSVVDLTRLRRFCRIFLHFALEKNLNLFKRFAFGFREVHIHKDNRKERQTPIEPKRASFREFVDEHNKRLGDDKRAEPVEESRDAAGNSSGFDGEYLAHDQPGAGTPGHGKSYDVHRDTGDCYPRDIKPDLPVSRYGVDGQVEVGSQGETAEAHSEAAHDQEEAPAATVDHKNGHGCGKELDHGDKNGHYRTVLLEAGLLKDCCAVKHNSINACCLLEEVNGHADGEWSEETGFGELSD